MKVHYSPQFDYRKMEYQNDLENKKIKVIIDDKEVFEHDFSNYEELDEFADPIGFPIVGIPRYIDDELHVTVVQWYR